MIPCRCPVCGRRKSLRRFPDEYVNVPPCRCGRRSLRPDRYRLRVERFIKPCNCMGYPFPHAAARGRCLLNPDWGRYHGHAPD